MEYVVPILLGSVVLVLAILHLVGLPKSNLTRFNYTTHGGGNPVGAIPVQAAKTKTSTPVPGQRAWYRSRGGWRECTFQSYINGGRKVLLAVWCQNGEERFPVRRSADKVVFTDPTT